MACEAQGCLTGEDTSNHRADGCEELVPLLWLLRHHYLHAARGGARTQAEDAQFLRARGVRVGPEKAGRLRGHTGSKPADVGTGKKQRADENRQDSTTRHKDSTGAHCLLGAFQRLLLAPAPGWATSCR